MAALSASDRRPACSTRYPRARFGGDVGVVEPAEVVLEGDDLLDHRPGVAAERLAHELQRVAEPLGGDPQVVERRDVGPAHHRLVGADDLVGGPDPRGHRVPDAVRLRGSDRRRADALRLDELDVGVDPLAVPVAVELLDQHHAGGVALDAPGLQERLEGPGLGSGLPALVGLAGLDQDVEVAHGAEVAGHQLEASPVALGPLEVEGVAEDPPRRPLAARRDAHPVQLLGVLADAGAGLARDHPGEVEAEDLAAGLGQVVVGEDAGRLGDDEPRRLGDGSGDAARRTGLGGRGLGLGGLGGLAVRGSPVGGRRWPGP